MFSKCELTFFLFLKILFIYLTESKRAQAGGMAEGERETGSPLNREPNARLEPRIWRS